MKPSEITIYHNPACGTSRGVVELVHANGFKPTIIEYLKHPPSREKLVELIQKMKISVRDLLRTNVEPYELLCLADPKWTDDQLIDFMGQHPVLMNRPIVETPLGAKLCRPKELVMEVLPKA